MTITEICYVILAIILIVSITIDMGLFSAHNKTLSFSLALKQFFFWIAVAILFGFFLYYQIGANLSISYFSAYVMEKSLSLDNIFVFIILFKTFSISEKQIGRLLLYGVLLAIIFRLIFIILGISIIAKFSWVLYIFGIILLVSGVKMFFQNEENEYNVKDGLAYKLLNKYCRIDYNNTDTTFIKKLNGKKYFTKLSLVVMLLGITDIIFAVDSIPAVLAISNNTLVVFSSNTLAVLGLRSLFFMLRSAANKFDYMQQGISLALVFIGIKLLLVYFNIHISDWVSFIVIFLCIAISIIVSIFIDRKTK